MQRFFFFQVGLRLFYIQLTNYFKNETKLEFRKVRK